MNKKILLIFGFLLIFLSGCANSGVLVGLYGENGEVITKNDISYQTKIGNMYYYNFDKVYSSGESSYLLECPNNNEISFNSLILSAENPKVKIELYENPTILNFGQEINLTNSNMNIANNQSFSSFINPTITNEGVLKYITYIIGSNNNRITEQFNLNGELILNKNLCYTIKITNQNNGNNHIVGSLFLKKS